MALDLLYCVSVYTILCGRETDGIHYTIQNKNMLKHISLGHTGEWRFKNCHMDKESENLWSQLKAKQAFPALSRHRRPLFSAAD